jgi:N-acetylglucosaminyldiphosphoundecaprenol N-acetyl-beta-D-mannosaminyltransferase
MWELMRECENMGKKVFFLGGTEHALRRLHENVLQEFPRLQVVGACSPPFGDWQEEVNHKMIEQINSSEADVLWVGVSSPKQDCWIASYRKELKVKLAIGVGAAFDFHSGTVLRAPLHLQRAGLEWFHRLLQDPKRLWRRYLYGNTHFSLIVIRQLLHRIAGGHSFL